MDFRRSLDSGTVVQPARTATAYDREILNVEAFHRALSLERRRTERSRKAFLLMLLDLGDQASHEIGDNLITRLKSTLPCTRETDPVGWYKHRSVLGIIFTEICFDNRNQIARSMIARISGIIRQNLGGGSGQVSISCHIFPEDRTEGQHLSNPILYPDLTGRSNSQKLFGAVKRAIDIVGSLIALIVGTPLFVLIAILIKITSRGPILFRQERIGQHGQSFEFLKFRSMHADNDPTIHKQYVRELISGKAQSHLSDRTGKTVYKLTRDPRITRVGAFLRRTSLDELPQFINVLKGEMSLVGPRPPLPYEVEAYDLWHRRRLLEAKPGITGLWQVSGRSRITFDDMVRLDLHYARSWTLWLDIKIILRTPAAILLGEGAH